MIEKFETDRDAEDERLDAYLAALYPSVSRSFFQKLIKSGLVTVDGKAVKPGYALSDGEEILVDFPEPEPLEVPAENIPLDIVYEDEDVILVNKPKGMVVHPAAGHMTGTLVNALLYHCKDLSGINGVLRPGIVHRIDKDTTGIVIACKNDAAHQSIAAQLKDHTNTRRYLAIVTGRLPEENGTIDAPIGRHRTERKKMAVVPEGKPAVTHYSVLEDLGRYSLAECRLETGRTHQIRVHMAYIHHPLLGDTVYGSEKQPYKTDGQCLHAAVFGFVHPRTGEYMEFSAPMPEYMEKILKDLRNQL